MSAFSTVLLTGATGFLGGHLLAQLLSTGTQHVICLVRSGSATAGKSRIEDNLKKLALWREAWPRQISVVCGDLEAPLLGLGAAFALLAGRVDAVYHNGAHVNYILNYAQLRQANVGGTQELARLAQAAGAPLFYVSTLRLFDHRLDGTAIREDDEIDLKAVLSNGYAYSKAMAERVVAAAARQGLQTAVFRPGLLCGNGTTGIPNVNDVISLLVRGCVRLGAVPMSALQVNLTSVDFAVQGMVAMSYDTATYGRRWHLVHDEATPINRLMDALGERGYELDRLPYERWVALLKSGRRAGDNDLNPLVGYFTPGFPEESTRRVFDSSRTRSFLDACAIVHPEVDRVYLRNNIDGMIRAQFLRPPSTVTAPSLV